MTTPDVTEKPNAPAASTPASGSVLALQIHTYVRKYNVEYVLGENWQYYASTRWLEPAREISLMLQAKGKSVRISEVHEGWKETEFVKAPNDPSSATEATT